MLRILTGLLRSFPVVLHHQQIISPRTENVSVVKNLLSYLIKTRKLDRLETFAIYTVMCIY